MPKFFVGQRVKLARPRYPKNLGIEGRFLGYVTPRLNYDCDVDWEGRWHTNISSSDRLEPILPEGHKAGDFSYEQLLDHLKELSHEKVS